MDLGQISHGQVVNGLPDYLFAFKTVEILQGLVAHPVQPVSILIEYRTGNRIKQVLEKKELVLEPLFGPPGSY